MSAVQDITEVARHEEQRGQFQTPTRAVSVNETYNDSGVHSRASPELGMAEIQGQVFDPTSGLTFLHRAWRRLSAQGNSDVRDELRRAAESQPMTIAGDKALPNLEENATLELPQPTETRDLITLYFEVCIATYRILHKPSVESWLSALEDNIREDRPIWETIGRAKAAMVLIVLALARTHREKSKGLQSESDESGILNMSDRLFCQAEHLLDLETGYPKLESAQARIIQVLYLLTTSRFNRSWFVFGTALQIISALGLQRRADRKRKLTSRSDYLRTQCGLRTFWTAYILDNYLGVIFGRPRHFNDEDIDQKLPDRVDDDHMTTDGPGQAADPEDCHIDALIFHTRIAKIIGSISREVYSIKSYTEQQRMNAVSYWMNQIKEWHASLPAHLGSVRPSMLIPSYKRQAIAMTLAHSHAIMHANRLFLLGSSFHTCDVQVQSCLAAAKRVLETVDGVAREGPMFHAFWWTHYVTFCALVIVYVWEIQQKRIGRVGKDDEGRLQLLDLAETCQKTLANATASNSPSRRYALILEEFRNAASSNPRRSALVDSVALSQMTSSNIETDADTHNFASATATVGVASDEALGADTYNYCSAPEPHILDTWQLTDWIDIDSSVSVKLCI